MWKLRSDLWICAYLLKNVSKQAEETPPAHHSIFDIIGRADISQKEPYSPQKLAAKVRAAMANRGSMYMQIAKDYGPPLCSKHRVEMVQKIIPQGYPNTGLKVWICPEFKECQNWEIVEK